MNSSGSGDCCGVGGPDAIPRAARAPRTVPGYGPEKSIPTPSRNSSTSRIVGGRTAGTMSSSGASGARSTRRSASSGAQAVHRLVEVEHAVPDERRRQRGHHRLRHRRDAEDRVPRHRGSPSGPCARVAPVTTSPPRSTSHAAPCTPPAPTCRSTARRTVVSSIAPACPVPPTRVREPPGRPPTARPAVPRAPPAGACREPAPPRVMRVTRRHPGHSHRDRRPRDHQVPADRRLPARRRRRPDVRVGAREAGRRTRPRRGAQRGAGRERRARRARWCSPDPTPRRSCPVGRADGPGRVRGPVRRSSPSGSPASRWSTSRRRSGRSRSRRSVSAVPGAWRSSAPAADPGPRGPGFGAIRPRLDGRVAGDRRGQVSAGAVPEGQTAGAGGRQRSTSRKRSPAAPASTRHGPAACGRSSV